MKKNMILLSISILFIMVYYSESYGKSNNIFIIKPGEVISKKQIEDLENRFKIKLPEEYKIFLLKYNGGIPYPNQININSKLINAFQFYQIKSENNPRVELRKEISKFKDYKLLSNFIPIGDDFGDTVFFIGLNGKEKGKIYHSEIYYSEPEGWEEMSDEEYLKMVNDIKNQKLILPIKEVSKPILIAHNFNELIQKFRSFDSEFLDLLIQNNTTETLKFISKTKNINSKMERGFYYLDLAILNRDIKIIKALLEKGAKNHKIIISDSNLLFNNIDLNLINTINLFKKNLSKKDIYEIELLFKKYNIF